ncbi:hypothetical protein Hanom_Chr01g00080941 [Helianthus anomalus]
MCFDTYVCLLRVKAKSNPPTAKTPPQQQNPSDLKSGDSRRWKCNTQE